MTDDARVSRQAVREMWDRWRREIPGERGFTHSDGVKFVAALDALPLVSALTAAQVRERLTEDALRKMLRTVEAWGPARGNAARELQYDILKALFGEVL